VGVLDARDRRILALAVPALGALAIEPIYVLIDTGIVGRLGTGPLGGLALASTVLSGVVWLSNFLTFGITSRVAFLTGQGDDAAAARTAGSGLWLAIGFGVPVASALGVWARPLAWTLGGRGRVLAAATTYLHISVLGLPAVLLALVGHGYLRGRSDTRTPLRVVAASNLINVALEVLFVYGLHWGVAGSAWGTVVAQAGSALWFVLLIRKRAVPRLRPAWAETSRLLRDGWRITTRTLSIVAAFTMATSAAARLGTPVLAAHQITMQVFLLLALSVDALAVAAQALIGTSLGAGAPSDAWTTAGRTLRIGVMAGAVLGLLLVALSPVLPLAFTGDHAVTHNATVALVVLGVMQVPGAVAFALDGVLMGAADFRFQQWATASALVALAPWMLLVITHQGLGIVGLWAGLAGWMTLRAGLNLSRCWVRLQVRNSEGPTEAPGMLPIGGPSF